MSRKIHFIICTIFAMAVHVSPQSFAQETGSLGNFEITIDEDFTAEDTNIGPAFDFSKLSIDTGLSLYRCNFIIRRIKIPEEKPEPLASGNLAIENGNIRFLEHKWVTGGLADESILATSSNLKFDKKGKLFGLIPVFPFAVSVGELADEARYPELQGMKTPEKLRTPEGAHRFNLQGDWDGEIEISMCKNEAEVRAFNDSKVRYSAKSPIADIHILTDVMAGAQQDRSIVHVQDNMIQIISADDENVIRHGSYGLKFSVDDKQSQYPNQGKPRGGAYLKLRGPYMQPIDGKWRHRFSIFVPETTPYIAPADVFLVRMVGISGSKHDDILNIMLGHRDNLIGKGWKNRLDNYLSAALGVDKNQTAYDINMGGIFVQTKKNEGRHSFDLIWPANKTRENWLDFDVEANWTDKPDGYINININGQSVFKFNGVTKTRTQTIEIKPGLSRSFGNYLHFHTFISASPDQLNCFTSELEGFTSELKNKNPSLSLRIINFMKLNGVADLAKVKGYNPLVIRQMKNSSCFESEQKANLPKQVVYIDEIEFQKID